MSQDHKKPPHRFPLGGPLPTAEPVQPTGIDTEHTLSTNPQNEEEASPRQSLFVPESESDEWLLKEMFASKANAASTDASKDTIEDRGTEKTQSLKTPRLQQPSDSAYAETSDARNGQENYPSSAPPPLRPKSKLVIKSRSQQTPVQQQPPPVGKSKLVVKSRSQQSPMAPGSGKSKLVIKSRSQSIQPGAASSPQTRPLPTNAPSPEQPQFEKPEAPKLVNNDPLVGQVINNRFRLLEMIGQGGMGKVYRAQQVGLTRLLVIKLLHPQFAEDPVRKTRFHREAEAMTRFTHPNAVTVFDFGEWNNQLYMAMELLRGGSLADLMAPGDLLPVDDVVSILEQVCQALDEAHKVGLIHRDLKPENVMLNPRVNGKYEVKLVDFGLAYFMEMEGQERLTAAGVAMGTPCYMSPEQARGKKLDQRTDIYALGVMLYEMLCGSLPFLSKNVTKLMMQHIFEQPVTPSERNPNIDIAPALEELALAALSKRPDNRPNTASEFRDLLLVGLESPTASERVRSSLGVMARSERASKLGLQVSAQVELNTELPAHAVAVVEEPADATESTAVSLVEQGFFAEPTRSITDGYNWLQETGDEACRVLVVSLGSSPEEMLQEVVGFNRQHPAFPVIAIGPSKDAALMAKALEQDVDYLPESLVEKKLPKHLRRTFKKHFRKKKRTL